MRILGIDQRLTGVVDDQSTLSRGIEHGFERRGNDLAVSKVALELLVDELRGGTRSQRRWCRRRTLRRAKDRAAVEIIDRSLGNQLREIPLASMHRRLRIVCVVRGRRPWSAARTSISLPPKENDWPTAKARSLATGNDVPLESSLPSVSNKEHELPRTRRMPSSWDLCFLLLRLHQYTSKIRSIGCSAAGEGGADDDDDDDGDDGSLLVVDVGVETELRTSGLSSGRIKGFGEPRRGLVRGRDATGEAEVDVLVLLPSLLVSLVSASGGGAFSLGLTTTAAAAGATPGGKQARLAASTEGANERFIVSRECEQREGEKERQQQQRDERMEGRLRGTRHFLEGFRVLFVSGPYRC